VPEAEIRAVSAAVQFDGTILAEPPVPGYADLQVATIKGNQGTLMMTWSHTVSPSLCRFAGRSE